jgi:hypothetical protein
MANEFLDLQGAIDNADDWLVQAEEDAARMADESEGQWADMVMLADRLREFRADLKALMPEGVRLAVKSESDMVDEMADKADAISY